jgi:hypothetical protein
MHIGKRLSGWFALGVFATVGGMVATDPAFAKVDVDKLTIGGEARIRYEYRNGTTFGSTNAVGGSNGQANESAGSHRVRVNVGYDLTPDVSFFAQVQDARVWGSECITGACTTANGIGTVSSANQNGAGVDLHQGYILVKNIVTPGLSAKIGRQEIIFGDHRLFGNFGWSQVGNSFDAARLTYSVAFADIDLFWARIIDTEVSAGCAAGNANCSGVIFPAAGTKGTTDQDVYGAYVTLKPMANWTLEPYYFLLKDSRPAVAGAFLTTPQGPDQARNILGVRLNGKAGGLDLTVEGDYQFGGISSGTNIAAVSNAHDMHISAHQEAAKIGYTFEPVPMKPRIGFEVDYASGDNCVASGAAACAARGHYNTADNLYPTNHFHYGYMDLMAWRNMVNYAVVLDIKPTPVSKLQVNYILHRLARTQDNWYRAGQVIYATTAVTNQAASLGQELDIHYWRTFKEKFKFEIGYGHFFAGEYLDKAAGKGAFPVSTATFNNNSDQNWGYVMGSVLF